MAQNISDRLQRLRARRNGTDRLSTLSEQARNEVWARTHTAEGWTTRASESQPNTRWVLGAMQPVHADYTRISLETGERVGKQLLTALTNAGIPVAFRLQGSVPLDIHIRGVSDVDLLTLRTDFLTYQINGALASSGFYTPSTKTSVDELASLRKNCVLALRAAFPATTVDVSGSKAVKISGGSLARPVDVVPSHWNDTAAYQASQQEHDRGITILDTSGPSTVNNLPFKHIKLIADRCNTTGGGLRKAIRLCKNVKAELESEGMSLALSSFDIASIMYHADGHALANGRHFELSILTETQRFLDQLYRNRSYAESLWAPDGSRRIIDSETKFSSLLHLSSEIDRLVAAVWKEQNPYLDGSALCHADYRSALNAVRIL